MFENLKKIQIEGGYFEPSSGLDLFDSNQCLSIIYGRNGSGKTAIAKAIRQLVGKDSKPQEGEVAVPYIVTSDAVIPEEKKPSVFIFDEEFVQENVRTKGNGLETIVMMGEQVDLDTQITAKKAEGTVVDSKVVEQTALKEKYENANDTSSPQYFFNKIKDELRKDGGWADTDRDIKGNTVKSRVTEDFVKNLANKEEPIETEDVLRQRLNDDFSLYTQTNEAQEIVWEPIPLELPADLSTVNSLLEKRVEKPELDVRRLQKRILADYEADFSKHAPSSEVPRIRMVWNSIPAQLAKENKKFIYGALKPGARASQFEMAIQWLQDAGLVYLTRRVSAVKMPLKFYEDFSAFKL